MIIGYFGVAVRCHRGHLVHLADLDRHPAVVVASVFPAGAAVLDGDHQYSPEITLRASCSPEHSSPRSQMPSVSSWSWRVKFIVTIIPRWIALSGRARTSSMAWRSTSSVVMASACAS